MGNTNFKELKTNLLNDFLIPIQRGFKVALKKEHIIILIIFTYLTFINTFFIGNRIFSSLVYCILLCIAVSPISDCIFGFLEDIRHVATKEEKSRLLPLFNEVYNNLREKNDFLSSGIKLYIVDTPKINAFSFGKSIILTRGMINSFNDSQLKGVIVHEFAHIYNSDNLIRQLVVMCMSVAIFLFYIASSLFDKICGLFGTNILTAILHFFSLLLQLLVYMNTFIFILIFSGTSKQREFKADLFAFNNGYGNELLEALKDIYELEISDKTDFINRLRREHPRTAYRIEKLEKEMNLQ